ncbi:MAG: pyridoxal 5'-phosphate synthase glutaminase subunit PdxT [Fimbriimonadaceae bacterium]
MPNRVGLLAIQGDFDRHRKAIETCGVPDVEAREVRTPEQLAKVDRLILPGGESTTVGLLLERYGLGDAIKQAAREGMPMWGTCMGMILMAHHVEGREQYTLDLLDITVRRNAFGSQVHSFEDRVQLPTLELDNLGVFIRAPIVTRQGDEVTTFATYKDHVVGVQQGKLFGTSFHPELTDDRRLHCWFLEL